MFVDIPFRAEKGRYSESAMSTRKEIDEGLQSKTNGIVGRGNFRLTIATPPSSFLTNFCDIFAVNNNPILNNYI